MKTHKTKHKNKHKNTNEKKKRKKAEDTSYTFEVNSFTFCPFSLI